VTDSAERTPRTLWLLAAAVLVGALVSVALGVYGREHTPTFEAITTFGFPTMIEMKVWLATATVVFAVVQLVTALGMYGRLGPDRARSARTALTHRVSGVVAVIISLPVAYHCLWSLGYQTYSTRVLVHSLAGCAFYGVFVTKMLSLHVRRAPSWVLPVLGGLTLTALATVVLTSVGWWFTHGQPTY
jgi:ABC-type dipeptide/oligopeptide/nickel transport system permease component